MAWCEVVEPRTLRECRIALGKSQAAFAAMLGVSPESYRTWDAGRRATPPELLARARALATHRDDQAQPQEPAERQRIGGPPRDAALRINAFEVPDQEQPEVGPRQQAWTADRGVERSALRFHEGVKPVLVEHLIQSLIERVPTSPGQRIRGNPQPRRSRAVLATTHGHAGSLVRRIDHVDPPLTTGC